MQGCGKAQQCSGQREGTHGRQSTPDAIHGHELADSDRSRDVGSLFSRRSPGALSLRLQRGVVPASAQTLAPPAVPFAAVPARALGAIAHHAGATRLHAAESVRHPSSRFTGSRPVIPVSARARSTGAALVVKSA